MKPEKSTDMLPSEGFVTTTDGVRLFFQKLGDQVSDSSKLSRGIHHDVDDLEAVRQHFGITQVDVIGHSYVGLRVALYTMKYPAQRQPSSSNRPMQPSADRQYPAHLTGADAALAEVLSKLAQLQKERQSEDPKEFCKKVCSPRGSALWHPSFRQKWTVD